MNSFSNLPEYLIDSVLQFTDVKDVVNFSNTNEEHKKIVNQLTENNNSFISTVYEISEICDIETWIFLPYKKYELKYAKQYYQIFKNIDETYYLTFHEVHNIFCGLAQMIKLLDKYEKDEEKQEQFMYVFLTLFQFIKNNIYLFSGANDEQQQTQRNMLNFLVKLFDMKISFIDNYEIYPHFLETFERLVKNVEKYDKMEKQESFEIDFIQSFFFYDSGYNSKAIDDLHNDLIDLMLENNLEQIMLIPDNEEMYDGPIDTIIDIDDVEDGWTHQ